MSVNPREVLYVLLGSWILVHGVMASRPLTVQEIGAALMLLGLIPYERLKRRNGDGSA